MGSFGELVLVLGDLHIPERSSSIPENFRRMLVPNKMQHILCTGNICQEQFNELCALAPNIHVVKGNFDNDKTLVFPEVKVVHVGQFRLGLIHGHQLLPSAVSQDAKSRLLRKLNVDVLVSGNTHQNEVHSLNGHFYINPGSITGAYSASCSITTPSFILLAIQGTKLVCYVYEIKKDGEVEVSKTEFTKRKAVDSSISLVVAENNPELLQSLLA